MTPLSRLIAPVSADEFRRRYWQQHVLHAPAAGGSAFADILTFSEVARHLQSQCLHPAFLRVVRAGADCPPADWTVVQDVGGPELHRVVDTAALLGLLADGATIVVNHAWRAFPGVLDLCRGLEAELSSAVWANLYATPPNEQGLAAHYDDHDVLVLQLHGVKHWQLFGAAADAPAEGNRNVDVDSIGAGSRDIELRAGDVLYLPRHEIHRARTHQSASIHLTLGFPRTRWRDVLRHTAERAMTSPGFQELIDGDDRAAWPVEQKRDALLARLRDSIGSDDVFAAGAAHTADPDGRFVDLMELESVSLDTRVAPRPGATCSVDREACEVRAGTRRLALPKALSEPVRRALRSEPVEIRALPLGLPDAFVLTIARDLIRVGALRVIRRSY
jgi:hypothetical protein